MLCRSRESRNPGISTNLDTRFRGYDDFLEVPFSRDQGKRRRKLDDLPLLHEGYGLKRRPFAALLQNAFEHLVKAQGRDEQIAGGLDGGSEELGTGAVGKVFEPAG